MKLTEAQYKAVYNEGNVLVEAGAGSGKTTLFVDRYLRLLKQNKDMSPSNILALTFTNKAASECLHRIYQKLISEAQTSPHLKSLLPQLHSAPITTFHGFCKKLLQDYSFQLNISPLATVLSDDESSFLAKKAIFNFIQKALKSNNSHIETYLLAHSESRLESDLQACFKKRDIIQEYSQTQRKNFSTLTQALLFLFDEAILEFSNLKNAVLALDYMDLIEKTNHLLDNPQIQKSLQNNYQYIMVDECQDTDTYQWNIIKKLTNIYNPLDTKKLFLVGDTKQCIYRFRGANLSFFSTLMKDFENQPKISSVISLTDNFRTSPSLLNLLNPIFLHIFENTTDSKIKFTHLNAQQDFDGSLLCHFLKDSDTPDAEFSVIEHYISTTVTKNNTIGILARDRNYCEGIYRYLKNKGYSVQTDKQKGFFSQQLVIDCYQITRVLVHPNDFLTWSSLLQSPLFNMTMSVCQHLLTRTGDSLIEKCSNCLSNTQSLSESLQTHIKVTQDILEFWESEKHKISLSEMLAKIIYSPAGMDYIKKTPNGQYQVDIFLGLLQALEDQGNHTRSSLIDLLEYKLSIHDSSFELPNNSESIISIMTIHAAKGLEFDSVFVIGAHKNFSVIKSNSLIISKTQCHASFDKDEDKEIRSQFFETEESECLDEEKRLFYVACTRAKKQLFLTGLYHQKNERPLSSYLSFLKSLPNYKERSTELNFSINKTTYSLPCYFQLPSSETNIKNTMSSQTISKTPITIPKINTKKTIHVSELTTKESNQLSLETIQYSLKGTVLHEGIMFILSNKSTTLSKLMEYCQELSSYELASAKLQKQIDLTLKKLLNSPILNDLQQYTYLFEHPLSYATKDTSMTGRADAIAITPTAIILLEVKTDACDTIEELEIRYQLQLDYYALCLSSQLKKDVIAYLYSSHLDQTVSKQYFKENTVALEKEFLTLSKKQIKH